MSKNGISETVGSLFNGLEQVLSTKTVVGQPQVIGDTVIVPLMDVSFGMGAGAFDKEKSDKDAGGIGGKMSPSAVLVIQDGDVRVVNIKNEETILKLIDMVPGTVNKVTSLIKGRGKKEDPQVSAAVEEELNAGSIREEI